MAHGGSMYQQSPCTARTLGAGQVLYEALLRHSFGYTLPNGDREMICGIINLLPEHLKAIRADVGMIKTGQKENTPHLVHIEVESTDCAAHSTQRKSNK